MTPVQLATMEFKTKRKLELIAVELVMPVLLAMMEFKTKMKLD